MTRIDRVTHHHVNDHDAGDTYQVDLLHLADGTVAAYRIDEADDDGKTVHSYAPAESGLTEFLQRTIQARP
jgi:hypothetical protein